MSPAGPQLAEKLGKRERNKAANRTAILGAAREVFAELGYGAATIRDVIRRTDLAAGTFYNYFPDKESVLRALVEENATELRARLRQARAGATTLSDFVRDGFRAYYGFIVEDLATFELMRRNSGTIRELIDEPALGAGVDELEADLRAAIARGDLPAGVDPHRLAAAMAGAAIELAMRMVSEEAEPDVEAATAFTTELFLGGIERMASGAGGAPERPA